jgi:hypothetical protein
LIVLAYLAGLLTLPVLAAVVTYGFVVLDRAYAAARGGE